MDTQGKTTHVQYFDNGLSDNSDEEIETVNHLTYVLPVRLTLSGLFWLIL
jgi:hypothetical protein